MAILEEDKEVIYPPESSHSSEEELSGHRWSDFHVESPSPFIFLPTLRNDEIKNQNLSKGIFNTPAYQTRKKHSKNIVPISPESR